MREVIRFSPVLALTLAASVGVSIAGAQTSPAQTSAGQTSAGQTSATAPKASQCFFMRDWQGSKPAKDSKALYIRVGVNQVYRLDLQYACTDLQNADARVINRSVSGADSICDPLDLDLSVYTPPGISSPCLVKAITPLTPAQAKALPPDEKP